MVTLRRSEERLRWDYRRGPVESPQRIIQILATLPRNEERLLSDDRREQDASPQRIIQILRIVRQGSTSPSRGCRNDVHKLQKVPPHSCELIDPEDGSMSLCSICSEALDGSEMVVKTLCSHFFHEDCLADWCSNHLNCPMCRRRISETDDPTNDP